MSGALTWRQRVSAGVRHTSVLTAWRFVAFNIGAVRLRRMLAGVETYCMFIGHARSGHSVVGALLDAHPQIAISDELDALRYMSVGFGRRPLLYASIERSRRQAANLRRKGGLGGTSYSYHVPGQWQGRASQLRVVGDSQAGWTTRRLAQDPRLFAKLESTMEPLRLRFIHVVRNPFDNVATMMLRGGRTFDDAFAQYATNCQSIVKLAGDIGSERLLRLRHEQLMADPRSTLRNACHFLGVNAGEDFITAAAGIVYQTPSFSRLRVEWPRHNIDRVRRLIDGTDFLVGYGMEA